MPKEPREFVKGEFYHIILRRLEENLLFIDTDDYFRGIFSLYEFNDSRAVVIKKRRAARSKFKKTIRQIEEKEIPIKVIEMEKNIMVDKRDLLVEIMAFCLMPNHIHLLVREIREGGISKFMQKLGSGLAGYIRNKYGVKIKGHFFQDRFTAVHIETDTQLRVVFVYIHCNPISLIEPKWKEKGIKNPTKVIEFVENYKWSSYADYLGKKNFPSLTQREWMLKVMGGVKGCREWVNGWIKQKAEIRKTMEKFKKLALEGDRPL